ncbi:aminopeptidase O isoform X2 [Protopterus annectens]|uniref:aminopeptidase O isoform X2 n=1 Tax=Protopterus annectens TaxID=7888 RepID=UPI001CFA0D7A|nr:aminopeptidase O isoform X2 [Protopterus annectens]
MDSNLDPSKDDLPLMANTSHILVRHYTLDLDVNIEEKIISGCIVLYLQACTESTQSDRTLDGVLNYSQEYASSAMAVSEFSHISVAAQGASSSIARYDAAAVAGTSALNILDKNCNHGNKKETSGISCSKEDCYDKKDDGMDDFVLILDSCDLSVIKVEEVDAGAITGAEKLSQATLGSTGASELSAVRTWIVQKLVALPAASWQEQHNCYLLYSQAPGCGELQFASDTWSLRIWKAGIQTPQEFPRAIRIWYKTKPESRSIRWTMDQDCRPCVYTSGSALNNRGLFPCQEPPSAMATWQATVRAPVGFVTLMSSENAAVATQVQEDVLSWFYYVTMPMPASTLTIAVGCWTEVQKDSTSCSQTDYQPLTSSTVSKWDQHHCGHVDYPCRFLHPGAHIQINIPYRVFTADCLREKCKEILLPLVPHCLVAAHDILGTHPFCRLDILFVPAGFCNLGMASPHIMFLSQSILSGRSHFCGSRFCHELAHNWFGLAIGAKDWTEEWISEGFATYLEDIFWAKAQKLSPKETEEQCELRALLRWYRLRDEVQNSEQELQVLRPKKDCTGEVSESGVSVIKHGLNPGKVFMQVHYLKGYFLLRFLASKVGQVKYLTFLRNFVLKFHGQLILSQDFLHMLLGNFPELSSQGISVENIYEDWLDTAGIPKSLLNEVLKLEENRLAAEVKDEVAKWMHFSQKNRRGPKRRKKRKDDMNYRELLSDQLVLLLEFLLQEKTLCHKALQRLRSTYQLLRQDAEVRHRWCELVVKHRYLSAYGDVKEFLEKDQFFACSPRAREITKKSIVDFLRNNAPKSCYFRSQEYLHTGLIFSRNL